MAARRIVTRRADPSEFPGRWKKAQESLKEMDAILERGSHHAASVLAIQAAIAAADAFTIARLGEQCASDRHEDLSYLVESVSEVKGVAPAAGHLKRLLKSKSEIEYSGRCPRIEEARSLCQHAKRFVEFVGKNSGVT